jgi:tRNA dimethylallyltransferase
MELARRIDGEIVSVDSMQVYRGMDIGTAKPTAADCRLIPHHLIDIADPSDSYSVAQFQEAGRAALATIADRGRTAIICGGSGLHFRSLVDPLDFPPTDPVVRAELESLSYEELTNQLLKADARAADRVDLANPRRVLRAVEVYRITGATPSVRAESEAAVDVREYRPLLPFTAVGVDPGDGLARRIESRLDAMLKAGWIGEVRGLGPSLGATAAGAVGYRELLGVVDGRATAAAARESALRATLALAKRQRTYFRRDPRIEWLTWHDDPAERTSAAIATLEEAGAWTL